jgi:hypothetical protein
MVAIHQSIGGLEKKFLSEMNFVVSFLAAEKNEALRFTI